MEGCAKTIWKSILARLAFDRALLPPLRGRLFYVSLTHRARISSFSVCFKSSGSRDSSHNFCHKGTKVSIFLIIVSIVVVSNTIKLTVFNRADAAMYANKKKLKGELV